MGAVVGLSEQWGKLPSSKQQLLD